MPVEIARVMQTMLGQNASEAWLVTGRPLMFRIDGQLREAVEPVLTEEDAEVILAPRPDLLAAYQKSGLVDFPVRFGPNAHFDVTVMTVCGMPTTVIRHLPPKGKFRLFGRRP
jgi:Tfp pilus assembly pilus retraction ATPase PilT